MRTPLFVSLAAFMVSVVSAATDCTVAPTTATKTTWCTACYQKTYSELVCSTCNSSHVNAEKTACVTQDCTATQTTYSDAWCNACDLNKKVASTDLKSCNYDCKATPSTANKTSWCSSCYQKTYSELVCSTCNSQHVNAEKTSCVDTDCTTTPTIYSDLWCNACDLTKKVAASDKKSCVPNCAVAPSTANKTTWCSACYQKTYSELVCNTCNAQHVNAEKTTCVDSDCTATQTTYSDTWCNACDLQKKVASSDKKACAFDCKTTPIQAYKTNWCSACYLSTYSELVCNSCNSQHINVEKTACVASDCSVIPTTYTDAWCNACDLSKKVASADKKSCVPDCSVAPSSANKTAWCSACYQKTYSELVCNTCNAQHVNAEKTTCVDSDCTAVQTTYTDTWCKACDLTQKVASSDKISCVPDCSVAPSAANKSGWCSACYQKTYSELVCNTCNAQHLNVEKNACVASDCSVTPTSYTDAWCNSCDLTKKVASADKKSCAFDCNAQPAAANKSNWCSTCYQKTYSELVCSTCNAEHVNAELTACVDQNCPAAQTTYTTTWCNACDLANKVASSDGKSCVPDCAVAPSDANKDNWCNACNNKTYSELVCNTCNGTHVNAEKDACVESNCTAKQAKYTDTWCTSCDLNKKLASVDTLSCVFDCKAKPAEDQTEKWCSACYQKSYFELVCNTCSGLHVNAEANACIKTDCKLTPDTYTTSWCSQCETDKQTGSADGKYCVDIDCSVKPTDNYSDDWCNACASPPLKALADKSACDKVVTTSTTILQITFTLIIALVSIL